MLTKNDKSLIGTIVADALKTAGIGPIVQSNVTPTKEETEDGKNILYFNYFKGGDKATRMPMKLEDVEKYWPHLYDGVKANYADFDNPVFDTYKTHFQENENQDSNNIVKENWNLLGGLVDDDKTPDSTL